MAVPFFQSGPYKVKGNLMARGDSFFALGKFFPFKSFLDEF